ncbi:hypothetical protein V1525DRAFT_397498 [Lipomyces kononenkoae]|uniref:Uncharacterized protein n=1 Tax=Lipomyces kononenkoae TaxID=34357 RepID=A0ACC3T6X1_LIPKO
MEDSHEQKQPDDLRLYDPRHDDCSRGPLSFAELNKGGPFVMCADQIEGTNLPSTFSVGISATDGKKPYSARLTSAVAEKIRTHTNLIPSNEWASLLLWIFLHKDTFESDEMRKKYEYPLVFLKGLKDHKKNYLISIEYYVDSFTNVLGNIEFTYDDNILINPMRWVSDSVREYLLLGEHIKNATIELKAAKQQIDNLDQQLKEILRKKGESEILILEKMRILLNEKKQKIHELGGDVDKELDFEFNEDVKEERPTTPNKRSRSTKTPRQYNKRRRQIVENSSGSEIDEASPHTPNHRSEVADGLLRQSAFSGAQRQWRRPSSISSTQTPGRNDNNSNRWQTLKNERSDSPNHVSTESDVNTEQSTGDN